MDKLDGRVAIVTGAAQGIGRAIAEKLAREGAAVLANDLDAERLQATVEEIGAAGGRCAAFAADVTDPDFGERAVEHALTHFGDLHIVINNAGYVWNSRILAHSDEQWQAMLDVHATGPFRLLRAAGRHFREQAASGATGRARKVVNVSSISGLFGEPTQLSYSAAKSALIGMTRSLAKDWGRWGVTVNCVAFGYIETRLTQTYEGAVPEIEVGGRRHKVGVAAAQSDVMEAMIPLGRKGTPEEAAGAVYLFCIPESDYITGEIVTVSGGLRA